MVGQGVNGTSCLTLLRRRAKLQGYTPGFIFQRLSLPPAVRNPRDNAQEGGDFCTAVQWVVAQAGWDILKVPVP